MQIDKNKDNKGNSKGFHQGSKPEKFGPDGDGEKNKVNGTPEPNTNKGKKVDTSVDTPRDVSLNAVAMPNKDKGNTKDYGIFDKISDFPTNVSGTPRPNHIS